MQDENTSKKSNGDYNGYAAGLAHGSAGGGPINNNHQFHANAANGHYSQQGSEQSGLEPIQKENNNSIISFLRGAGSGTNEAPKMEQNATNSDKSAFTHKRRFNEREVGPVFDELFRTIKFKIVYQDSPGMNKRHSSEIQFMNDFICKQMEYFQTAKLPQGHTERLFLKVLSPKRIIELNMVKLDTDSQVLFLFKEVSIYNKLSKAKTTEKFSNILINSIAHNLFTPLNALIQLNKGMSDLIEGSNEIAEKNVQMIGVCL